MANFLQRFAVNFANLTKGFMHLLKKDRPFFWDEQAQESFDALKQTLASAPFLSPPNYSHDFFYLHDRIHGDSWYRFGSRG